MRDIIPLILTVHFTYFTVNRSLRLGKVFKMFGVKTSIFAIAVAAVGFAGSANATTIQVDPVHSSVFGDENGHNKYRIVTQFSVNNVQENRVYAGAFRLKSDQFGDLSEFLAFCLQPLERLTLPKAHEFGSNFSASVTQDLQILAQNAWSSVTDKVSAAAFQMAAWEITTETMSSYDIDDGVFAITYGSTNSNAAEGIAQGWLDNISTDAWTDNGQEFVILNAEGTQDLLTNVAPVPLPASGLMLAAGLLGAGAVARRKARKS